MGRWGFTTLSPAMAMSRRQPLSSVFKEAAVDRLNGILPAIFFSLKRTGSSFRLVNTMPEPVSIFKL